MKEIRAILFDADGVIQLPSTGWRDSLCEICGDKYNPSDFIKKIFIIEEPCLKGIKSFPENVSETFNKMGIESKLNSFLVVWTAIESNKTIITEIRNIRKQGVVVALASNQEKFRAEYMNNNLGYEKIFDYSFYSYEMGFIKSEKEYFENVLTILDIDAHEILFFDDSKENIESATNLGINSEYFCLEDEDINLIELIDKYKLIA
jgi:putative hydrolase of the HAD superfamily